MSYGSELPPPGWYPDPENLKGPKRWWDGSDWTDRRRMDGPQPPAPGLYADGGFAPPNQPAGYPVGYGETDQFPGLDRVMSFGGRALGANWLPLALIELLTRVLPAIALQYFMVQALDGLTVNDDGSVSGFDTGSLGPFGASLGVASLLSVLGASMIIAIALGFLDENGEHGSKSSTGGRIGRALRQGLRRTLPMLGWYLVFVLALSVPVFILLLLIAVFPPIIILLIFAVIPASVYLFVKFGFSFVAVVDGPGNPFSRSMKVSAGRFWSVFGSLLVAGLAIFLVSFLLSVVSGIISPPLLEPVQLADSVQFSANTSAVAFGIQGVVSLVLGIFIDGFGGGVAALLYRSANPRPAD